LLAGGALWVTHASSKQDKLRKGALRVRTTSGEVSPFFEGANPSECFRLKERIFFLSFPKTFWKRFAWRKCNGVGIKHF
jgi:hypothetical protein